MEFIESDVVSCLLHFEYLLYYHCLSVHGVQLTVLRIR